MPILPLWAFVACYRVYFTLTAASYIMVTGSFPGVQRPGRGVGQPPEVKERVELYLYSSNWPSLLVIGRTLFVAEHCWYNRESDYWPQLRAVIGTVGDR
jgi:hypothetical protein